MTRTYDHIYQWEDEAKELYKEYCDNRIPKIDPDWDNLTNEEMTAWVYVGLKARELIFRSKEWKIGNTTERNSSPL